MGRIDPDGLDGVLAPPRPPPAARERSRRYPLLAAAALAGIAMLSAITAPRAPATAPPRAPVETTPPVRVEPAPPVRVETTPVEPVPMGLVHFGRSEVRPLLDAEELRPFLGCERVLLVGHTCSIGSEPMNLQVGLARARSVQRLLADLGYDEERISIDSRGSREPVAGNGTAEGRRANRRVTVVCVPPTARNP